VRILAHGRKIRKA